MEVLYTLTTPFTYAHKGDTVQASFVTLTAANHKMVANFMPIQQAFYRAITELNTGRDNDDIDSETTVKEDGAVDITADGVIFIMSQSSVDMAKVAVNCELLFKAGCAQVDGEAKLTSELMHKITMEDVNGLIGTYIANFIKLPRGT